MSTDFSRKRGAVVLKTDEGEAQLLRDLFEKLLQLLEPEAPEAADDDPLSAFSFRAARRHRRMFARPSNPHAWGSCHEQRSEPKRTEVLDRCASLHLFTAAIACSAARWVALSCSPRRDS